MDIAIMLTSLHDRWLVSQFLTIRSESAFRKLYSRHTPALYRLAMQLSNGDGNNAEELIQTTWVRAVEKMEGFLWKSKLRTWLISILINVSNEHQRKHRLVDFTDDSISERLVDTQVIAERMDIKTALKKLPGGYRIVFILHDLEGYKHFEIGELLNISEGTSKSQLFNARKLLKKYLQ